MEPTAQNDYKTTVEMQTLTLSTVVGQWAEYVHLPVKKIIPLHVEDYVFIWDYRWYY